MQASEGVVIAALYRAATINMLEETRHLIKSLSLFLASSLCLSVSHQASVSLSLIKSLSLCLSSSLCLSVSHEVSVSLSLIKSLSLCLS